MSDTLHNQAGGSFAGRGVRTSPFSVQVGFVALTLIRAVETIVALQDISVREAHRAILAVSRSTAHLISAEIPMYVPIINNEQKLMNCPIALSNARVFAL
jgi:hypothetical protein